MNGKRDNSTRASNEATDEISQEQNKRSRLAFFDSQV
jgi:hypothetical protein